jgi:serine protease Do
MARRVSWPHCGMALLLGILIGNSLDSTSLKTVQANALDVNQAEALYRELGANAGSLVEGSQLLAKIAKLTTPSVVHILSQRANSRRSGTVEETGSGVLVTSPKATGVFVVTNRHVVAEVTDLNDISIHLHDGRVVHPVQIWKDKPADIAVMKVSASDLEAARWGDSDKVEIGHMVLAMGSPFGLSQSMTYGIISAKGRRSLKLGQSAEVLNQDFLQTDAAINPGNSGGPLIDLHGRIIGINTAIASNSGGNDGIGFSIPSNLVRRVVDDLLTYNKVPRAYLGVKLDPSFTPEAAAKLKLDRSRGARVVEIYPDTPASRAKMQMDDVILIFNQLAVEDHDHLIHLVSMAPVDRPVDVVVSRNGQRMTLRIVLGDRSDLEARTEAPAK